MKLSSLESFIINFLVLGTFAVAQLSEEELRHLVLHLGNVFLEKDFEARELAGRRLRVEEGNIQNCHGFCLSFDQSGRDLVDKGSGFSGEKDFMNLE